MDRPGENPISILDQTRGITRMSYSDKREQVYPCIRTSRGYGGNSLIDVLTSFLPMGAKALELGIGAGKDLLLLNENCQVKRSDSSAASMASWQTVLSAPPHELHHEHEA